jgi:hypothetical protein
MAAGVPTFSARDFIFSSCSHFGKRKFQISQILIRNERLHGIRDCDDSVVGVAVRVAAGADLAATFVFFADFAATLVRFELFVAFLDRFCFFAILFPPWNSHAMRMFREK